jgi:hypothetical protein
VNPLTVLIGVNSVPFTCLFFDLFPPPPILAKANTAMLTMIKLVTALLGKRRDMDERFNILTKVIKKILN